MNIIKHINIFFKNIFEKKEKVKTLKEAKQIESKEKKANFTESLRIDNKNNKKIETLICEGNGLGIQKKISC